MTHSFEAGRSRSAVSALFFAVAASCLVFTGCDSSTDDPEETQTISPDVLDVQVEPGQVRNEPYWLVDLTNTAERGLFSARASFRLWDSDTRVHSTSTDVRDLPPGTTFSDSLGLTLLDDLSEYECYTYQVSVTPFVGNDQEGVPTEKDYTGTCPDDHPANQASPSN